MGIAGDDGVKVYRGDHPILDEQVTLDTVNDIVAVHDVVLGVHFQVEADKAAAGAVIVDHQVMHAQHAGVAQCLFLDVLHQFRVGGCAQQRVNGVFHKHGTAVQDERRYAQAHQAVDAVKAGELRQNRGCQHRCRGDDVIAGVSGSGKQRLRLNGCANVPVEGTHPELNEDGCRQHRDHDPVEGHRRGVQDFGEALFQQLHTDDENHHRHSQPGQVFIPRVAVGMFRVCRACAELEPHKAYDIGTGVGEVVHAVCSDGNAAGQHADGDFSAR